MQSLLIGLTIAAAAFAYGPLLWEFGYNLWQRPHYQHFPFVILASGLLAARAWALTAEWSEETTRRVANGVIGAAWVVLLVAQLVYSPMLAASSAVLLVGGLYARAASVARRRFAVGSWMLLWLIVPLPLGLDQTLIGRLQLVSSSLASQTLDLLGVYHLMDGNTLVVTSKQLFVDEACSGIVSVVSTVACAAIYGVYRRRSAMHTISLMAAGAGWATLNNVVRIVAIALAEEWHGIDWTEGTPHTLIALVAFSISLLGLVLSDWLLDALLAPVGPRWAEMTGEPLRYGAPLVRAWDRTNQVDGDGGRASRAGGRRFIETSQVIGSARLGVVGLVAFATLGAAPIVLSGAPTDAVPLKPFPDLDQLVAELGEDALPPDLAGLELLSVEHDHRSKRDRFGEHSIIYTYEKPDGEAFRVSIDFPYRGGWHELEVCYVGIGWQSLGRATVGAKSDDYRICQLTLSKPNGTEALVTFAACFPNGDPIEPVEQDLLARLTQSFLRRNQPNAGRQSYQIQVVAIRADTITEADRRVSVELLDEARRAVLPLIADLQPTDAGSSGG
ncbi:MAG: exosortase U [Planctomycetota bacterium]